MLIVAASEQQTVSWQLVGSLRWSPPEDVLLGSSPPSSVLSHICCLCCGPFLCGMCVCWMDSMENACLDTKKSGATQWREQGILSFHWLDCDFFILTTRRCVSWWLIYSETLLCCAFASEGENSSMWADFITYYLRVVTLACSCHCVTCDCTNGANIIGDAEDLWTVSQCGQR